MSSSLPLTISLRSWIVLIAIGLLIFLMNIDYTAVNLTLVPISEDIHADLNSLQWLLSGYVLIWAAFVIPAGRLADLYGKKAALIGGLSLYAHNTMGQAPWCYARINAYCFFITEL